MKAARSSESLVRGSVAIAGTPSEECAAVTALQLVTRPLWDGIVPIV